MKIWDNVLYNIAGHAIYFELATETYNCVLGNIVIDVLSSFSMLNTDQTPASFYLTHPTNYLRDNVAAGSPSYGFWYALPNHSRYEAYDENVCPDNAPLGQFKNNRAHSNGLGGLWISDDYIPKTYPCLSQTYSGDPNDPYPSNPLNIAEFEQFTAYKNG